MFVTMLPKFSLHISVQAIAKCPYTNWFSYNISASWPSSYMGSFAASAADVVDLHFFSDGRTTQYRNKMNFYLLSTRVS